MNVENTSLLKVSKTKLKLTSSILPTFISFHLEFTSDLFVTNVLLLYSAHLLIVFFFSCFLLY